MFLEGNKLGQRWQNLVAGTHFVIVETGFGTGLNFLATWQLWRELAPERCHLHYISIEKHPIPADQLARGLAQWPQLRPLADALLRDYPLALPGIHQIPLGDSVTLSLGFEDIIDALGHICDSDHPLPRAATSIEVDAWMLDGFAPAKNPDMWSPAVFQHIAALSKPGTSFATFTAAGSVRRGLSEVGFTVSKTPGFGRKRDMLVGSMPATSAARDATPIPRHPTPSWHCMPPRRYQDRTALVIGAGLAGCHTARALAESGWRVQVLEQAEHCAAAASGNPTGILYTRLAVADSDQAAFGLAAYQFAARHYRRMLDSGQLLEGEDGMLNGMLQLGFNDEERTAIERIAARYERFQSLVRWQTPAQASDLCGLPLDHPALFFPASGWLRPTQVCRQLLAHPAITLHTGSKITDSSRNQEHWHLHTTEGSCYEGALCVICAGVDSRVFKGLDPLPTRAVGGQVTMVEQVETAPDMALCHSGYVAPLGEHGICCGASFRVNDAGSQWRAEDDADNLEQLAGHIPALATATDADHRGRASVRCTTPDYLPIIGPVPAWQTLLQEFAPLARNARQRIDDAGSVQTGLFVNTGHGSRGLSTTPIAAALIAALANRTPRPLPWPLLRAVHPARFAIRDLVRGKVS